MSSVRLAADFTEFKYIETLESSLLGLLEHLTELLDAKDQAEFMSSHLT
jgi:hypothetical protein